MPDGGLRRRRDLELGEQAVDVLDVAIDRASVIAPQRDGEPGVASLLDEPLALGCADDRGGQPAPAALAVALSGPGRVDRSGAGRRGGRARVPHGLATTGLGLRHRAPAPFYVALFPARDPDT